MPLPKKWKVVGGSVSAAVLLGSGIATAQLGDAPGRIALDDQVPVADAVVVAIDDANNSVLSALLDDIAGQDDSMASPFDDGDDTPDDLDTPADEDSVDSPESDDSVESLDDDDSVDSPDDDSVDSPDDDEDDNG